MIEENNINVLMVTIPLRDDSAGFRPLGPLSIMKHLRNEGFGEVDLYDIDYHRPSFEDAVAKALEYKPDILGISAVVSTSYEYTKMLSQKRFVKLKKKVLNYSRF